MANWLTPHIRPYVLPDDSVLDLCCGIGGVTDVLKPKFKVGVDIYEKYVEKCKELGVYDKVYLSDSLDFARTIGDKSFDVVICLDGVEHIEESRAKELIDHMERIAKRNVIIWTPVGFITNEIHNAWEIEGGDNFQQHQCGFEKEFFEKKGYTVETWYDNGHWLQLAVLTK